MRVCVCMRDDVGICTFNPCVSSQVPCVERPLNHSSAWGASDCVTPAASKIWLRTVAKNWSNSSAGFCFSNILGADERVRGSGHVG